jgi:hypothetical protein
MHWSFFLDSGASPLEGNAWQPVGDDQFRSATEAASDDFSPLDLYLMGAAEAAEVEPFRLLRPADEAEVTAARDCRDEPLGAASPPARCASLTLHASAARVSIEDVIAVEGERVPAAVARQRHDVAVIVLESERAPLALESCRALDLALERHFARFEAATQGRVSLHNATGFQTDCESVSAPPTLNDVPGCALGAAHARRERAPGVLLLALACTSVSRACRRRAPPPAR